MTIITAAHCVSTVLNVRDYSIVAGEYDLILPDTGQQVTRRVLPCQM